MKSFHNLHTVRAYVCVSAVEAEALYQSPVWKKKVVGAHISSACARSFLVEVEAPCLNPCALLAGLAAGCSEASGIVEGASG